jgi:hypothetical protein
MKRKKKSSAAYVDFLAADREWYKNKDKDNARPVPSTTGEQSSISDTAPTQPDVPSEAMTLLTDALGIPSLNATSDPTSQNPADVPTEHTSAAQENIPEQSDHQCHNVRPFIFHVHSSPRCPSS